MAVDDNPANLKLITALLKERVETVISCTSGQQAIDKATETQFDIIFMDIQMPQMDGVTACQNIKKLANNANTPVIAVTAHAMTGERDRLLDAGMDDYLTKPIEEHVLQQVLIHWSPTSEVEHIEKINPDHPAVSAEVDNNPVSESNSSEHKNIIIDWQAAMKQAANKEDLARDMLQMLVDFIPEVYDAAEKAIEDTDYPVEQLIHIIHKMHGSSSYSGVPRLKSVCATIEKELRSGTSIEDIEPELFELQDELDKVQATAVHYLKPTSD
jgi:two-component system sensor histidine kinase BarA